VTLADRGQGKRLARVWRAPLIAGVRSGCAVLHETPAVAASAAGPQFRVELLERTRTKATQTSDRYAAERWPDETVDQQPVAGASGLLNLMTGQPLVEQVTERDVRPRGRGVPHLGAEPVAKHDRRVLGVRRAGEKELPTRHRVVPPGDPNLVGATALTDAGEVLGSLLPTRHTGQCSHG